MGAGEGLHRGEDVGVGKAGSKGRPGGAAIGQHPAGVLHEGEPAFGRGDLDPGAVAPVGERVAGVGRPVRAGLARRQDVDRAFGWAGGLGRRRCGDDGKLHDRIQLAEGFVDGDVLLGLPNGEERKHKVGCVAHPRV
jgi:hypothetical protein